jgi:hypothetical protein
MGSDRTVPPPSEERNALAGLLNLLHQLHGLLELAQSFLQPSRSGSQTNVDVARATVERARELAEQLIVRVTARTVEEG